MTIKESGCAMLLVGLFTFLFFLAILISMLTNPPQTPSDSPPWLGTAMYVFIGLVMLAGAILSLRGLKIILAWVETLPEWQKKYKKGAAADNPAESQPGGDGGPSPSPPQQD
ncbi:alkaline shock response membrane anchor protein AmaP [Deltaproteobacteria bacterium OttesenSCG-928-K17]|nr:alkaline shock response membrane anchor protein AmaP [Deltaproteobacteria bacterium OttesenSCG-928-K17]